MRAFFPQVLPPLLEAYRKAATPPRCPCITSIICIIYTRPSMQTTDCPLRTALSDQQQVQEKGTAAASSLHSTAGPWDRTTLHAAVCGGQVESVEQLLAAGAPVEPADAQHWTPLHLAAIRGLHEVSLVLLQHGADPSPRDLMGRTPLHFTARSCSVEVAKQLLQHGASPAAADTAGRTPVHDAALRGAADVVAVLLQHDDVTLSLQEDNRGMVPLMCAAHRGHEPVVQHLLPVLLEAPPAQVEVFLKSAAVAAARSSYMQVAVVLLKELGRRSPAAVGEVVGELQAQEDSSCSALLSSVVLQWVADCAELPHKVEKMQREQEELNAVQHQVQGMCLAIAGALHELQAAEQQD